VTSTAIITATSLCRFFLRRPNIRSY